MLNSFGGLAGRLSQTDILTFPLTGLIGYPFGALPAAATGLLLGLVSSRIRSKAVWILSAVAVGTLASMLMPGAMWMFAITGAGAALVSALVAVHVRPRWSNQRRSISDLARRCLTGHPNALLISVCAKSLPT